MYVVTDRYVSWYNDNWGHENNVLKEGDILEQTGYVEDEFGALKVCLISRDKGVGFNLRIDTLRKLFDTIDMKD